MLRTRLTGDSWWMSVGDRHDIDFAVWTLGQDGLLVPPFDKHGEGNGELRALGLDGETWEAWVSAMIATDRRPGSPGKPVDLWPGNSAVRQGLQGLWRAYGPISNGRALDHAMAAKPYQKMNSNLWRDLKPYHKRIPAPLLIGFVSYPFPVEYMSAPATAILGFPVLPEPVALKDNIRTVAAHLAAG
jgi:hypothetical protein